LNAELAEVSRGRREENMNQRREIPAKLNALSERVIGCAIKVHRNLGPGVLEELHEEALLQELPNQKIRGEPQVPIVAEYKGVPLSGHRLDRVIEQDLVVKLKAVEAVTDLYMAQLASYRRAAHDPMRFLINFNVPVLKNGIHGRATGHAVSPASVTPDPGMPSASSASSPRPPDSAC